MVEELSAEELEQMQIWFAKSSSNLTHTMELLPINVHLAGNFTFDDFRSIVVESRKQKYWFKPNVEIPLILAYSLIILFGCVSNGLICYIILMKKKLRTVRNLYIVNLSVSDIIMCVICMPFTLIKLLQKNWTLGDALCRLIPWLQGITVFVSTLTITAISVDRYKLIVQASYQREGARKWLTLLIILSIWFISVLAGLPLLVYSKVEEKDYIKFVTYNMCLESWPSGVMRISYAIVTMAAQFVIPICVLISVHWQLCSFLKTRILKNPTTTVEMSRSVKEANRHRKNSTLLMAIAISFALCWFPLSLLNLLADLNYNIFMFHHFLLAFAVTHLLAMTSACLNPILYGWFNPNFRREVRSALCCRGTNSSEGEKSKSILVRSKEDAAVQQKLVFSKNISYKAIQTEVQPVLTPSTENLSSTP